jgi:hypothetical protein
MEPELRGCPHWRPAVERYSAVQVTGALAHHSQHDQGQGLAGVGGLVREGFGAGLVSGPLPQLGQVGQGEDVAGVDGLPVED